MTLTKTKKRQVIAVFHEAAIAFYLGGDWRALFRYEANKSIGTLHRTMRRWSTETDEHFNNAIELYLEDKYE